VLSSESKTRRGDIEEVSSAKVVCGRNDLEQLAGTVKFYERHVFVCSGVAEWPARVELDGGFVQALVEAVAPFVESMTLKVKLTACDEPSFGRPERPGTGYDLMIFPDNVRYLGVRESEIPLIVQEHLLNNCICDQIPHEPLAGWHVFVCVHGRRDERCGACGPPLAERFRAELARRGLTQEVAVRKTSHVGGHRYAGNVLMYPGGDWYGCVSPDDVSQIVEKHLEDGELVTSLWRGRMGMTPEEQAKQSASLRATVGD
jgi:(2Fe-2S) ferredoxin